MFKVVFVESTLVKDPGREDRAYSKGERAFFDVEGARQLIVDGCARMADPSDWPWLLRMLAASQASAT
jgi:hypothetical protein